MSNIRDRIEFDLDPNLFTLAIYRLEGQTLPGIPRIAPAQDAASAIFDKLGLSFELQQIDQNTWASPLRLGESYVIGWIVEDKKLFGYCSEPFIATKDIELTFSPGMPITLEYDLSNPPDGVNVFPVVLLLPIKTIRNNGETYLSWGVQRKIDEPSIVKIEGLAAGAYRISAQTSGFEQYIAKRAPFLFDKREVEVKPGTVNRFEAIYPVIDTTVEENDVTIQGTLYDYDKKPLPDTTVELIPYDDDSMQTMVDLYYNLSTTDQDGKFKFAGIRPNTTVGLSSDFTSIILFKESLPEGASISVELVKGLNSLPLILGAPAQDLVIDWKDGSSSSFSDMIGKTLVVIFWATWSESSGKTVSELNSLAQELSDSKDVVFIGLNLDYNHDVWEKAVNDSEWKALRHGWFELKKNTYALNRHVPFSIIIDKNGILRTGGTDLDIITELEKILAN